jgi:large subunit ribosomal protein L24
VVTVARIKRGDTVEVITGNERGARGVVQRVYPEKQRVVVQSINIVKKHQRPVQAGRGQVRAGIIEFEAPINLSNVMLVCPACDERTRVGFSKREGDAKVRICKQCGSDIE